MGGLGFAPSANIGSEVAIFEAVHGSAPKYAGKDVINPTALILSAVLMLRYLGLFAQADAIEHAVLVTLEDGVLTGDVVGYGNGASTTQYTEAIIGNLGRGPRDGRCGSTGRSSSRSSRDASTTCDPSPARSSGWTSSSSRRWARTSWAPR